ncbi:bifunctional UDP-sugar hydrolase/5'-nucleotidase [Paenibacillus sp. MMS20-IR301]|uniref:bifunctional metallophosphatase/5'-nucleotidase n=1 Tax=Paenibacillus sp. MMS20-IR301 TaxID=2895946 RepID=UPI0028EB665D|nr:bifunctional UDP-sugar hydrolase/5'-nucleotidase [Paenibacillus sp. MMS20-IR301]WNS44012.1 bifunctional UDP-sugar hydrolase/5'-nucleotidase [Paenibacillus sp. MMS20-IR301]
MTSTPSVVMTLLQTSDIHGHLYPTDYRAAGDQPLGLAKLATLIAKERSLDPELLLLDNGDLLQGTPLMYHYAKLSSRQGRHPAGLALKLLGYDAAVLGNHEFNYGPELLNQAITDSDCPWLAANIVNEDSQLPAFGPPYRVFTHPEGIRIAVLGLTTHYIPNWESPAHIAGLEFKDALESAQSWIARIREQEQPDALVVCYHGGFERDPLTGEPTEPLTGENQGYAMCRELSGIDVLLTGHQHRLLSGEVNGVAIAQPGSAGQAMAKVQLEFVPQPGGSWKLHRKSTHLLMASDAAADEDFLSQFTEEERATQAWLDQPIGSSEGDLSIPDPFTARLADHPFTEFVNRVQLAVTGAEISCAAIFTNEARGFGEQITMRDVVSNYIYPNTLKVLRLSGRQIREALEQNARYFAREESGGGLRVSPDYLAPKPQHYNYDMWEGMDYTLDISQPVGQRVVRLERGGLPLTADSSFEVVMNSYRAGGGGNFDMLKGATVVREIPTDMTELLADYIREHGVIRSVCNHNWQVIY